MSDSRETGVGRREFVATAAAAATITILKPSLVFGTQANSAVRLGVLGCGGRGLNVTGSFLKNTGAVVTAVADAFADNLEKGTARLNEVSAGLGKPAIAAANAFKGMKSYEALFASKDIDAVYIATPPYFHPMQLAAALAAGKHVYLEKPVSVDVPGAKKVTELGKTAAAKKLSLAVGFQIRHASPYVELAKRIHEGQIGAAVSGQIHYFASALNRPEWPNATPAEVRLRNWVHDKVLSGDIIVEQNCHIIDVTNWLLKAHPVKVVGSGGRAGRTDKGDAFSHFNCVFTYPGDVHVSFSSTQFGKAAWGVGMQYYGTKGCAEARYDAPVRISGETTWEFPGLGRPPATDQAAAVTGAFRGALEDADPNKQKAFIESITSGNLVNEAQSGAESTLTSIIGRMAAYTGKEVTWDALMKS
jgi:predicted dehydrogenase